MVCSAEVQLIFCKDNTIIRNRQIFFAKFTLASWLFPKIHATKVRSIINEKISSLKSAVFLPYKHKFRRKLLTITKTAVKVKFIFVL